MTYLTSVDDKGNRTWRRETFTKYPELLADKSGKTYLAPNCYCMVDLSTGKTVNRPEQGLEKIQKRHVAYVWEQK